MVIYCFIMLIPGLPTNGTLQLLGLQQIFQLHAVKSEFFWHEPFNLSNLSQFAMLTGIIWHVCLLG